MREFMANHKSTKAEAGCQAVMRSLNAALAGVPGIEVTGRRFLTKADFEAAA